MKFSSPLIFVSCILICFYLSNQCGMVRSSSIDNIFIKHVKKVITEPFDIVNFDGPKIKALFGDLTSNVVYIGDGVKTRSWENVVDIIRRSKQISNNPNVAAIHLHNEHKIGDLFQIIASDPIRSQLTVKSGEKPSKISKKEMNLILDKSPYPIVVTNTGDENWGFLSTPIGTRTTKWINMTNHLRIHSADYETVRYFLDSQKILLLICNTHIDPQIGAHEKVISLPLGVKQRQKLFERFTDILAKNLPKTKILTINNSGWGDRTKINQLVSEAFNHTVKNSYHSKSSFTDHYEEMAQSRFVLCPSGLGMDSYRIWEALVVGAIPIVESNEGFDRTYSNLPVLVLKNYSSLTPSLLEKAYECFFTNADKYKYIHLSQMYWQKMIYRAVITGKIKHVVKNHPFKNLFCDFSHI